MKCARKKKRSIVSRQLQEARGQDGERTVDVLFCKIGEGDQSAGWPFAKREDIAAATINVRMIVVNGKHGVGRTTKVLREYREVGWIQLVSRKYFAMTSLFKQAR